MPQLRPVRVGTADELGELAQAFNRVQQVASSLVERQLVSRQNVATMFGNVGRRTQNLVGRQLAMIDSLERNEQDPALLDRLYRLDHVSTRLRRNANSLVVLSGAAEQQITGEPLSVADTIRSALGEIEGFQRVRLGAVGDARAGAGRHLGRDPAARRAAGERHVVLAAAHRGRGRGADGRRRRRADPDRRPRARHDAGAAGGGERPAGLPGAARPGADRRARAVRGRAAGAPARHRRAAAPDAGHRRDGGGTDPGAARRAVGPAGAGCGCRSGRGCRGSGGARDSRGSGGSGRAGVVGLADPGRRPELGCLRRRRRTGPAAPRRRPRTPRTATCRPPTA